MHNELIHHSYIMGLIKQAIAEERRFYGRKQNTDAYTETEISFLEISDNNLFFLCNSPEKLQIQEQDELLINFSVRLNGKLLPCELKVRVTKFRFSNGALFFSTTFPISVNHMQRRLFVRYPINIAYFQQLSMAFTNSDFALADKWQNFYPDCINWGDISIGGIMFYSKKHEDWNKTFTNKSSLILNCIFNAPQANSSSFNAFHIACSILEMRAVKETNLKYIRAKFTHWTYQNTINWKKVPSADGIEALAKYLFQYSYKNKISAN